MRRAVAAAVMATAWALAAGARADVWDDGPTNDNTAGAVNELMHGSDQVHDLAGQAGNTVEDVDWFRVQVPYNSSFEVLVDGLAGGVGGPGAAPIVELVYIGPNGTSVWAATPVTAFGSARRIAHSHAQPISHDEQTYFVRVRGAACGAACTSAARYRIRMVDNTLRLPRFNNTQGQTSVLIVQNAANTTRVGMAYAFGATGEYLGVVGFALQAGAVQAIDLSTTASAALAGKAGSLRILSDAPHGTLTGKGVQLDPTTGFIFETALDYRPY